MKNNQFAQSYNNIIFYIRSEEPNAKPFEKQHTIIDQPKPDQRFMIISFISVHAVNINQLMSKLLSETVEQSSFGVMQSMMKGHAGFAYG